MAAATKQAPGRKRSRSNAADTNAAIQARQRRVAAFLSHLKQAHNMEELRPDLLDTQQWREINDWEERRYLYVHSALPDESFPGDGRAAVQRWHVLINGTHGGSHLVERVIKHKDAPRMYKVKWMGWPEGGDDEEESWLPRPKAGCGSDFEFMVKQYDRKMGLDHQ